MNEFFSRIWNLVRPYRGRLALGIVFGILSGFVAPLLVLTIKLAVSVIFPAAQDTPLLEQLEAAPRFIQNVIGHLSNVLPQKFSDVSTAGLLLIIACIPAVMILKGVTTYVNIYMMQWVGVRAIMDLRNRLFSHFMSHSASFF